jgi:hypothetical protein
MNEHTNDEVMDYVRVHVSGYGIDSEIARRLIEAEESLKVNAALLARQTDLARVAENKVAPLLDCCKWLLFHAENGRRWKTVAHRGLDFTDDEFEGRLRSAISAVEGDAYHEA